jgi:hypothetical protein
MSELAQFVRAAVARYSEAPYRVRYWEFYNEPDNGDELYADAGWGYFGHQPEAYVAILRAVYDPIKWEDQYAQVVFGGLAYDAWEPDGPFVQEFLDNVLKHGGGQYFDLMNFHYYPAFEQVWSPYGADIIGKANYIRRKMAAYGVNKPLICTETGMWSNGAGGEDVQRRYVVQVLTRSKAAQLEPTIWFRLTDETASEAYKFGLVDAQLNPKPAYTAYQTVVKQLAPTQFVRTLDPGETGSAQIEAYDFQVAASPTHIVVAWTNDGAGHRLALRTHEVVMVNSQGVETVRRDGDDGRSDGQVWIDLDSEPVFLRFTPQ